MKLEGSTIHFLGDSITQGVGVASLDNLFTNRLLRACRLRAANNFGISGTRIARQGSPDLWNGSDRNYESRYVEMPEGADAVVVFGGTNDFGHGDAPLGDLADRSPYTFCGACRLLMEGLMTRFSGSEIVFMTPLHRLNENDPRGDNKPADVGTLKDYVDALRALCEHYALPVLDVYANSGLQPACEAVRVRCMPDGLHPNDAGHAILASRLEGFLRAL